MGLVTGFLPLAVALALLALVPLSSVSPTLDARLTQFARRYFGRYVPEDAPERQHRLRAAYIDETYRAYAAKTYVITAIFATSGVIIGVYVFGGLLLVLPTIGEFIDTLPNTMANALGRPELDPELTRQQVFYIVLAGGAMSGLVLAGLAYWLRWEKPRSDAEVRRRGINEGLPRTVAFVYALSRGGMETPETLRTLARNRTVYGDGADELSVAVREMDLFGSDLITAIRKASSRTPSERFKTFAENFASVLQSGQSLSSFLRNQYDRYQDEAEDRQAEILELLSTIAEAYVTILVAGVLFLMTILLIFGLTTTSTINFLRLLAYLLIPLANVLFMVYLDGKLDMLGIARGTDVTPLRNALRGTRQVPTADERMADGGELVRIQDYRKQLNLYDSVSTVRRIATQPFEMLLERPTAILYVTVPIALAWIAFRMPAAFTEVGFDVRTFDDTLIRASLFVVGSFAIVWELYSRRIRRLEAMLPELLERLASLNEAGMSMVEGLDRVRDSDLGVLSAEVERIWRDVRFGANVDDALRRFGIRLRTTATTRVVTLVTNALRASGNLGPVLRIAAEQAESELSLRQSRRQTMLTYLVVIYISFLVFLVIILAVQEVLVPSLPNNVPAPTSEETSRLGVDAGQVSRFGQVNKAAYTLVFFHAALIQAVTSGFIGGQLGEGSLKDGAKHVTVMLGVAYLAFVLISSPTAQITFQDQSIDGRTVVVDSVSLTDGGYVVVRTQTESGEIVGHSRYLSAGTHEDVEITLDESVGGGQQLYAIPHLDTDDDRTFEFTDGATLDRPYPSGRTTLADPARVST